MEAFSLRLNPQVWKPGVIHLGVTSNLQEPGSHKSEGAAGTPPAASGWEGPPAWREREGGSEWNQSESLWREGGVESGRPRPESPITDAHRWKELDTHSSTKAGGLFDRVGGEGESG